MAFSFLRSQIKIIFLASLLVLGGFLSGCAGGLGSSGPANLDTNLLNAGSSGGNPNLSNAGAPSQGDSTIDVSGSYPSGQVTNVAAGKRPDPDNPEGDGSGLPPNGVDCDAETSQGNDTDESALGPREGCGQHPVVNAPTPKKLDPSL